VTPERLRHVEELYHLARERGPGERDAFLARACAGDTDLLREVTSLLDQDSDGLMAQPALEVADGLIGGIKPGARLGPYEILGQIGEGGMGAVYKARDTRLGRSVAIKTTHEEFSGRFHREARAISSLNHPHICTLHDVGPNYLVMELVEGETLADRLQGGRLPTELALRYGAEIADALSAAHSKGIIHRDLKPSNIMIAKGGVKVLDFGLAKLSSGAEKPDSLTDSHTILGTPAYMAPEQLEGKECDARTDIFALGLLLYEMAAGRKAFQGDSRAALIAEIMRCEPNLSDLTPPHFAHIVEQCLARDPENRWQTARDVKLELEYQARTTAAVQPPARPRRLRYAIGAVAAIGLLCAAALSFRIGQPEPSVVTLTSYPGNEMDPSFSRMAPRWRSRGTEHPKATTTST
jgi:serine/threonine protein kinase